MEKKVIWKYELLPTEEKPYVIELPKEHRVLCVQEQRDNACIWVLVDPGCTEMVKRKFMIYGTGHPVDCMDECPEYIGTFQLNNGRLVFHLWMGGWVDSKGE